MIKGNLTMIIVTNETSNVEFNWFTDLLINLLLKNMVESQ